MTRSALLAIAIGICAVHAFITPARPASLQSRPVGVHRRALDNLVAGRKGRPGSGRMPGGGMMPPQQQQQMRSPELPPEGESIFYLYCRTKSRVMWYPVSMMRGDGQSKGLINAWLNSPFGKGVFKGRLDAGMARSIFESERKLTQMAKKQYPSLKKMNELEWGYKIIDRDVMDKEAKGEIEQQKIVYVTKEMVQDSLIEKAKKAIGA